MSTLLARRLPFVLALVIMLQLTASPACAENPRAAPNFLLDVSRAFVSAAVAQTVDRTDPVRDVILKTRISGTGRTVGKVDAELIANDDMGVIDLVTTGTVTTTTVGVNGPVQLYSDSTIPFQIRQRVYLKSEGIAADRPCAQAEGNSVLTGMSTDFQCLDPLVRKIACRQYRKNKEEADYIASRHAEDRLSDSAQAETGPRLRDADAALAKNLADLRGQGVDLSSLRYSTSTEALFVRANIAQAKAAAPPPPPAVPDRPYLALRLHESAVSAWAQANLAGKTYTGEELEKKAKKLGSTDAPMKQDDKDFTITLTKVRPLEVAFADHGWRAVLRLAEFTSGDNEYSGMDMTVTYKFQKAGDKIKAVRQGPIEAFPPDFKKGQKLSARQQSMRTVLQRRFGKFFKEELELKDIELSQDLRQAGPLSATRADGERGWLLMTWRRVLP
jgi:hypothetical protein